MTHPATEDFAIDPAHTSRMIDVSLKITRDAEFRDRVQAIVDDIELPANHSVVFERDKKDPEGRFYLQVACRRPDTFTGEMGMGGGRKAYLTEHVSNSEVVGTVMALLLAYVEHEAREGFLYKGRRVYGPHIDVDALWEVAERTDARQQLDLTPAATKVPEDVQKLIDDQRRYEASYREQVEQLRGHLSDHNDDNFGTTWMLVERADAHGQIAFILGTLPFEDAEAEIRAQLAEKRDDKDAASCAGDEGRAQRASVLADIWVCALNEVTDLQRRRARG